MAIPLTDLTVQYEGIKKEIDEAVNGVLGEARFILGPQVAFLEEKISKYFGVKHAVGVASGTDALAVALLSLDIGKGDEVITTPFTFIATAEAISRVGAKPVFCDIDERTYNIDAEKLEEKINPATKAILPVHLYGFSCEMDKITSIAKKHNLRVVEDCAQSFGATYQGRKAGSFGDAGCLSFFPGKTLGCYGDGGMVVTNDEKVAQMSKMVRNHGSTKKYHYGMHGLNSRLDTMQAAILLVKLKYIDKWIKMRQEVANNYCEQLKGLDLSLPYISSDSTTEHGFNYFTIRTKKRDKLQEQLSKNGIANAIYYPLCLHLQEVYKDLGYKQGDFPIAEAAQRGALSLPMYPELDKENIEKIAKIIKEVL